MDIRNNILKELKSHYIDQLLELYDKPEAELLVSIIIEHYFGMSRIDMAMNPDKRLSESEILSLHMSVKELKNKKPVQYITGVVEFSGLSIHVDENVLIPRPETEELVNLVLENERVAGLKVLDIGTGSGCIAIVVCNKLVDAEVVAVDISPEVVKLAQKNADRNEVKVSFELYDILSPDFQQKQIFRLFDVIVSNPPYVTLSDKEKMHANVLDYEPHGALFVPEENPLIFYDAIFKFAEKNLISKGRVYFEINESFSEEMKNLAAEYGYQKIMIQKDIRGKNRFMRATKA